MKRLMSVLLGLSLAIGAASVSFADDTTKKETKKKGKKKKTGEDKKPSA